MARYKHYDYGQTKLLPISYERQILPGTFEHTLSYLIDNKIDLSVFEDRYQNDAAGAPAYDPAKVGTPMPLTRSGLGIHCHPTLG